MLSELEMQLSRRGKNYDRNMPSLKKIQKFNYWKVIRHLVKLPSSKFRGQDPLTLAQTLFESSARRYLQILILNNEKEKSSLKPIHEASDSESDSDWKNELDSKEFNLSASSQQMISSH